MEIAGYLKLSYDSDYDTLISESEIKIDELKQIMKPTDNMCNMEMIDKLKRVFTIARTCSQFQTNCLI